MNTFYQRPMGGIERMRLWFPNINVVMAARIKGNVTAHDLKDAIEKARRKHPLLGARVQIDDDGVGRFTTEGVPENPITVIPRKTDQDWLSFVKSELQHGWEIHTGPLARFTMLHSPAESDLVVNAHHSICDARSLAFLIGDLLDLIVNPDQQVRPIKPVSLAEAVPRSASGGFLYRLIMKMMNKKWLAKGFGFDEADYHKLHQNFWRERQAKVLTWALSKEQTSVLVERCRMENASVNSAVYAAFLAAQDKAQDTSQDFYKNVMVPVDFRDYLTQEVGKALGLYASAVKLQFRHDPETPFWETVRILDRSINKKLTEKNIFASQRSNALHPNLMDGIAHAMFGDFDDDMAQNLAERMQNEVRTGILVSNLGRLDLPSQYGYLQLAWIKPPAVYAGNAEKALEVLTIGGRMHFTLTYGEMEITDTIVEQVKKIATEILTRGADWRQS